MSYLVRRLEFFVITLWAALTINFILPRIMPGNPAQAMLVRFRGRVSPETVKAIEVAFGFHSNEPIWQQYLEYLRNTLTGNFGTSVTFFPVPVADVIRHGTLPALTIVITSIGGWILTMRNTMITTLAEDYVKMSRAKGLSPVRIMFMYAGRNAILPNLVGFAMSLGFVISGAILVEIVFNYPGVGFTLLQAVHSEDFALMQTLFLLITIAVLVAVLAADFLTAWLDPRTREQA